MSLYFEQIVPVPEFRLRSTPYRGPEREYLIDSIRVHANLNGEFTMYRTNARRIKKNGEPYALSEELLLKDGDLSNDVLDIIRGALREAIVSRASVFTIIPRH